MSFYNVYLLFYIPNIVRPIQSKIAVNTVNGETIFFTNI